MKSNKHLLRTNKQPLQANKNTTMRYNTTLHALYENDPQDSNNRNIQCL